MHEFSLLADLFRKIETVVQENNANRAVSLTVQLGGLSHISPEHFREHFDHAKSGTPAEFAELDITETDEHHPNAQDILLKSIDVE